MQDYLGRSGNPTWLAGNPTKSLARNPTSNCGKWGVQKSKRRLGLQCWVMCHMFFGIIAIQFDTQRSKHKRNQTPGSKPPVSQRWQNFIQLRIFHTRGKIQLAAPVARKPRTATMAHKGAMEGPDFTGASPGVFGRWWMMPLMGSEFRRNHLGMFKTLYHK